MEKYSNQNNRTPEYQHYTGMKAWITLPAEDPWPVYVKVKVTQLCPTLCNPLDYTVHGILQARILEWVAFPFSKGSSQPRDQTQVSRIAGRFFTNWAIREEKQYGVKRLIF